MELENPSNGDEIDSSCSTPYVSAPSSPGRNSSASPSALCSGGGGGGGAYFFSAPASPMHYVISSSAAGGGGASSAAAGDIEFEFSSRYLSSMISADELFFNGQIRPVSSLKDSHSLDPIPDEEEPAIRGRDLKLRSGSIHRRARSHSPLRNTRYEWPNDEEEEPEKTEPKDLETDLDPNQKDSADPSTPSVSASSSRSSSSSSSRSSKRWIFLKDLLYRSKSEGRERERVSKERFWNHISFIHKEKSKQAAETSATAAGAVSSTTPSSTPQKSTTASSNSNGGKRRFHTAHERFYTANRAQMEEMRRRTFLPYRQGLLGCLGFSSRSYSALNGFTKTLNPVFSR